MGRQLWGGGASGHPPKSTLEQCSSNRGPLDQQHHHHREHARSAESALPGVGPGNSCFHKPSLVSVMRAQLRTTLSRGVCLLSPATGLPRLRFSADSMTLVPVCPGQNLNPGASLRLSTQPRLGVAAASSFKGWKMSWSKLRPGHAPAASWRK